MRCWRQTPAYGFASAPLRWKRGSKGNLQAIVDAALAANPQTRLCIAAIALETLQQSIAALAAHGLAAQVTQIAVSRSKAAGSLHLMMANNPVFLIVRE